MSQQPRNGRLLTTARMQAPQPGSIPPVTLEAWKQGAEAWAVIGTPARPVAGKCSWVQMGGYQVDSNGVEIPQASSRVFWCLSVMMPVGWVKPEFPEWKEVLIPERSLIAIEAATPAEVFMMLSALLVEGFAQRPGWEQIERGEDIAEKFYERYYPELIDLDPGPVGEELDEAAVFADAAEEDGYDGP